MFLLAGCTSDNGMDQDSAVDRTIPADGDYAVRVHLDDGKRIEWSWTATDSLRFDVVGPDGTALLSREGLADSGPFTATAEGEYTVVWRNGASSPVDVRYTLRAYGEILD